jgi:4,5-DOPA dioxygenase extradiol
MSDRMPTLFLGHGSPENAIADNAYTRALSALAADIPRPEAILVVSAHYMTEGSALTSAEHPRTIHDFYGFPEELYEVRYPAPGAPKLAADVAGLLGGVLDSSWGLDHGAWSPMRHIWPDADVPTVELSIDLRTPPKTHYELGRKLSELPDEGVLVVGSGNIVHNLGAIDWNRPHGGYEWCSAFDAAVNERLEARDDAALIDYAALPGGRQSVPTPDHYLPLLYAAAAAGTGAPAKTVYEGLEMGSLSMRCVRFG